MFDTYIKIWEYLKPFINQILGVWYLILLFFIFLYLIKKYSDNDFFGLKIETGDFGSGKTYNNTLDTSEYSKNGFFIISNVRNTFVDLKFDSKIDLEKIFAYLLKYSEITNKKEFIEFGFRPIVFNIDEAHNYFFSRTFQDNIDEKNIMIMTQVRKRNILATFITQELSQLDIFIRRLTGGIIKRYYSGLGFIRFYKIFYVPDPTTTNLNTDDVEGVRLIKKGIYLAPSFLTFFSKKRRSLLKEKYVSKIIVGFEDLLNDLNFMDFLINLYPLNSELGLEFWKIYKKIYGNIEMKSDYDDLEYSRKRKKEIDIAYANMQYGKKEINIEKFISTK